MKRSATRRQSARIKMRIGVRRKQLHQHRRTHAGGGGGRGRRGGGGNGGLIKSPRDESVSSFLPLCHSCRNKFPSLLRLFRPARLPPLPLYATTLHDRAIKIYRVSGIMTRRPRRYRTVIHRDLPFYRFATAPAAPDRRYRGISSALTHPERIYLRSGNSPPNAIKGSKRSGSRASATPSSPFPPHGERSVFQVAKMDSSWQAGGRAGGGSNVGNAHFGFYPPSVRPSVRPSERASDAPP